MKHFMILLMAIAVQAQPPAAVNQWLTNNLLSIRSNILAHISDADENVSGRYPTLTTVYTTNGNWIGKIYVDSMISIRGISYDIVAVASNTVTSNCWIRRKGRGPDGTTHDWRTYQE